MKKNKITATLYYIASVLFYIASIMGFASGNPDNSGVIWLCLGSTFLCLGSAYVKRSKDEKKENETGKASGKDETDV